MLRLRDHNQLERDDENGPVRMSDIEIELKSHHLDQPISDVQKIKRNIGYLDWHRCGFRVIDLC